MSNALRRMNHRLYYLYIALFVGHLGLLAVYVNGQRWIETAVVLFVAVVLAWKILDLRRTYFND